MGLTKLSWPYLEGPSYQPTAHYTFFLILYRVIYNIFIYLLAFIHDKLKQNDLEYGLGVKSTLTHVLWRIMNKSSVLNSVVGLGLGVRWGGIGLGLG